MMPRPAFGDANNPRQWDGSPRYLRWDRTDALVPGSAVKGYMSEVPIRGTTNMHPEHRWWRPTGRSDRRVGVHEAKGDEAT